MPLECEHIRNEFSALLDNELNPEDRELVEEHLSDCSDCLRELHGYKVVSDIYRYHHPVKAPEDFEARFHAAIAPIGRKRNVTWQRLGLAAAAGFTLIAGVAVWQSQSRLQKLGAPEMASHLASDSVPQSPPTAEAPQALMFKNSAAERARESIEDKDAAQTVGALESAAAAPAEQSPNTAVDRYSYDAAAPPAVPGEASPATRVGTDLRKMDTAPQEALPQPSTDRHANGNGAFGGGGLMPQAAPAPAPASSPAASEPAPLNVARKSGDSAADMKSKAVVPSSPSAEAKPSPESVDSAKTPERATVEMKIEAGVTQSESNFSDSRPALAGAARKESEAAPESAATTAPAPPASITWHDQNFKLIDGIWRQDSYADEALVKVAIPSDAWNTVLDLHPDLAKLCDRVEPVIVKLGDVWYQFTTTPATPAGDSSGR